MCSKHLRRKVYDEHSAGFNFTRLMMLAQPAFIYSRLKETLKQGVNYIQS